jgi:hypothetical protein
MLGGDRISPCDEKQQLARIGDALEDLLIGHAISAAFRWPEIDREVSAGRLFRPWPA